MVSIHMFLVDLIGVAAESFGTAAKRKQENIAPIIETASNIKDTLSENNFVKSINSLPVVFEKSARFAEDMIKVRYR